MPAYTASIIIPAYNQAAFLAEAVESARAQTHPDTEVIVVSVGERREETILRRNPFRHGPKKS